MRTVGDLSVILVPKRSLGTRMWTQGKVSEFGYQGVGMEQGHALLSADYCGLLPPKRWRIGSGTNGRPRSFSDVPVIFAFKISLSSAER